MGSVRFLYRLNSWHYEYPATEHSAIGRGRAIAVRRVRIGRTCETKRPGRALLRGAAGMVGHARHARPIEAGLSPAMGIGPGRRLLPGYANKGRAAAAGGTGTGSTG